MFHLGMHGGSPLVYGNFEAWEYGPVHPTLYHEVKGFGAAAVQDIFQSVQPMTEGPERLLLDSAVAQLSDSTSRLVAITHWKDGAWFKKLHSENEGGSNTRRRYSSRVYRPEKCAPAVRNQLRSSHGYAPSSRHGMTGKTDKFHSQVVRRAAAIADEHEQRNKKRYSYANIFIRIAVGWLVFVGIIVLANGFDGSPISISDKVIMMLLGTATANVLAPAILLAKYLFRNQS